jgi:hypothetical protein
MDRYFELCVDIDLQFTSIEAGVRYKFLYLNQPSQGSYLAWSAWS